MNHINTKFVDNFYNLSKSKAKIKTDSIFNLNLFHGIENIENEESSLKEIVSYLGIPDSDKTDNRGNRIIRYSRIGLEFKFLSVFNQKGKNPTVSFIKIRKPFRSIDTVYPGLKKDQVHSLMGNVDPFETNQLIEIWRNKDDKYMKFNYDLNETLESIVIY